MGSEDSDWESEPEFESESDSELESAPDSPCQFPPTM